MPHVLIVEDEANVRKLVAVNLVSRGYQVQQAVDVREALDQLSRQTPDLLVLDIKLIDDSGWDLLTRIADNPAIAGNFPVLVMTASATDAHPDSEKYPQVVEVLIKPFSAARLIGAVQRALHRSPAQRTSMT